MSSAGVSPSSSGPSGVGNIARACTNCVRAKAKCSPIEFGGKCQRCHRLQRDCEPSLARERAQPRKRKIPATTRIARDRVEKLEEKLDGLVTLLEAANKGGAETATVSPSHLLPGVVCEDATVALVPANQASVSIVSGFAGVAPVTLDESNQNVPAGPQPSVASIVDNGGNVQLPILQANPVVPKGSEPGEVARWEHRLFDGGRPRDRFDLPPVGSLEPDPLLLSHKPPPPPTFQLGDINLGDEDPDILLNIFRQEMNPNFPFISVPDTSTAEQLRRDSPTLFTAIMAVTSRVTHQQKALGKMVMKQLAERIFVNEERNMDILLGGLTYAGWCRFQFYNIPVLSSVMAAIQTIIVDLRLNRPEKHDGPSDIILALREANGVPYLKPTARTSEERRAFLGYFFLTSFSSSFFRRMETMKWTPYIDECCIVLNRPGGHRDDLAAVAMAKIQFVTETISLSPWHRRADGYDPPTEVPPTLYMNSLRGKIKSIQTEFGAALQSNACVLLHYQNLEILLYKIGLSKASLLSTFDSQQFNRLEYLYACLHAVKLFQETFWAIPTTRYHCFSISMLAVFTQVHGILQLLSTFDHPDWDLTYVKNTVSFTGTLDKLTERFGQVKFVLNLDPHTTEPLDLFSKTSKKSAWVKAYFESKNRKATAEADISMDFSLGPADLAPSYDPMDFLDDTWYQTFLGAGDQQFIWQ